MRDVAPGVRRMAKATKGGKAAKGKAKKPAAVKKSIVKKPAAKPKAEKVELAAPVLPKAAKKKAVKVPPKKGGRKEKMIMQHQIFRIRSWAFRLASSSPISLLISLACLP